MKKFKVLLLSIFVLMIITNIKSSIVYKESTHNSIINYEHNIFIPSFIKVILNSDISEFVDKVNQNNVRLTFGGDILMDSYFADYINQYGVDYSWTDISNIFKNSDIAVVNLETSVSEQGSTKKPKGYGFRSAPYTLEGLVNAGIDLVSTANNHILDYGKDAFFDTIDYLNEYNIHYAGIGSNIEQAQSISIIEKNNIKIGFISYSSIIPWQDWRATETSPGLAPLEDKDIEKVIENIKNNDDKCDVLILLLHWGVEYNSKPEKKQIELAHQMIEAGADIIIGHHPHVLQGVEFYNDRPIFYSVGNLIFFKMNEDAGKTCVFELEINKDGFLNGHLYPVYISECKANLLTNTDPMYNEIINKMISLSSDFKTEIDATGTIYKK